MRYAVAAVLAASVFCCRLAPAAASTTGLVRGVVRLDGNPTTGVTLTLAGEDTELKTQTEALGNFVFVRVPFGRYTLTAHREGVEDASLPVEVQSNSVDTVVLDLRTLKEIGRTQTALVRGVASSPVGVNTLNRAQISTMPGNQSLYNLITTMPGIVQFSYNEPVAHGFHGLSYELDGITLPQGTASNFSEIIDPRTIDSLEVITGAFPAEYGGYRQGAVVNIISHRAADLAAPEQGSFTAGAGTYQGAQSSISEAVTLGNSRVFFNANLERTGRGLDSPTFVPQHDDASQSNQFLRTITNLGKEDVLAMDASNNFATFQIPINTQASPASPLAVPPATDDVQLEYDSLFNLALTHNSKDGTAYTQIAPWYHYDRIVYDGDAANDLNGTFTDYTQTPPATAQSGSYLHQDRTSTFTGLRLVHFQVFGANAVKAGVDQTTENFTGNEQISYLDSGGKQQIFIDDAAQRGTLFDAYVQDKWTPTEYLSLFGGLRYDHSTGYVSGSQLSPRLEINGKVDPQTILHGYFGTLYAAPFLEDTRRAAVVIGGGNAGALPVYDLQPERDSYYEVGLAHQFTPGARAYVNLWKRNVSNVLDTTQLADTPIFAVYNNTIGISKGAEARVDARWSGGDSMFVSATLSSSQAGGISGGTFLVCPPPATRGCVQSQIADVTLQSEDHDQAFAMVVNYTKRFGRERRYFAGIQPEYGTGYPVEFQSGPARLPPHLTFDASFGRDPRPGPKRSIGFTADLTNIANNAYLIKVNNGFNTTQWAPGFHGSLRLTYPF